MREPDGDEREGEERESALRAAETEEAWPREEREEERDQVEPDRVALREKAETEEGARDRALERYVLLERPEAEDDAGETQRDESGLHGGRTGGGDQRGKEGREGADDVSRGLSPTAPDDALEHEGADEAEDRRRQAHRPFLGAEDPHHRGQDPGKENRRPGGRAQRHRRKAEKLIRSAGEDVARADRPASLVGAEQIRLTEQHEPQQGARRESGRKKNATGRFRIIGTAPGRHGRGVYGGPVLASLPGVTVHTSAPWRPPTSPS